MKKITISILTISVFSCLNIQAQTNMVSTSPVAEQIMLGNFNPASYASATVIEDPGTIVNDINDRVSPDSLKSYLFQLRTFKNRNTGADTISSVTGIGAARKWVYEKLNEFSLANESRLIPSYLKFDLDICGITKHKNIFGVLPSADTSNKSIIIIEGHMDSRCEGVCDTACVAEGMEDNGSGTALVLELARVMSKYTYKHTIVFLVTIGEEQGLYGAKAFANYAKNKGIKIKAVLNNDVIGGIICGKTSSAPSCPGLNHIDSTQVRLFSAGGYNSFHKGLSRFIKLEYKEELLPLVKVPMTISIMSAEDRTGRGGDHIPFRQQNYPAMRFTSANEHGDASNGTGYDDRQHTSDDILGVDTDGDMVIDSFFVDFNYLARNAAINGTAASMAAVGPKTPDFTASISWPDTLKIQITQETQYLHYRVGLRTTNNDWDTVYSFSGSTSANLKLNPATTYYISTASVDPNGIESVFSKEIYLNAPTGIFEQPVRSKDFQLLQNVPNPSDEATIISVLVPSHVSYNEAYIRISDISGKEIKHLPISLKDEMNEVLYEHGYNVSGVFIYALIVDGKEIESKRMVFAN